MVLPYPPLEMHSSKCLNHVSNAFWYSGPVSMNISGCQFLLQYREKSELALGQVFTVRRMPKNIEILLLKIGHSYFGFVRTGVILTM